MNNQPAMSLDAVRAILKDVKFKDWNFNLETVDKGWLLQVQFIDKDIYDGELEEQKGRKWYISPYMIPGEVIKTAFLAVLQAMEHEIRETFLYKGKKILGPHIAIEALVEVADTREHRA